MGPPPDPEQMISMLENPQFASTMNEALQNPHVIDQMIQGNPLLRGMGAQVRQAMQDPNFRRMMTDPAMMRQMSQMSRQFGIGAGGFGGLGGGAGGGEAAFPAPGVTDTTPGQEGERAAASPNVTNPAQPPLNPFAMFGNLGNNGPNAAGWGGAGATPANPFAALFQPPGTSTAPAAAPAGQGTSAPAAMPGAADPGQQQANNPFANLANQAPNPLFQNPALMQQMLSAMGGGGSSDAAGTSSSPAAAGFNPFALFAPPGTTQQQAEPPRDTRPPEERYEDQLRQLNEMGFYEFDRNVEALRRTGGSVQGAVEYLLSR